MHVWQKVHSLARCDIVSGVTESEEAKRLGAYLRKRRYEVCPDAKVLGPRVGVTYRHLYRIERGESVPNDETTHNLERALHLVPGAISRILAGGAPEELDPSVVIVDVSPGIRVFIAETDSVRDDQELYEMAVGAGMAAARAVIDAATRAHERDSYRNQNNG